MKENEKVMNRGEPAAARHASLGITKGSPCFISSASFQRDHRLLTEPGSRASPAPARLQKNVIVNRLIPVYGIYPAEMARRFFLPGGGENGVSRHSNNERRSHSAPTATRRLSWL
jgi:hypothetical protein